MSLFGEDGGPDPRDGPPPADQFRPVPVVRAYAGAPLVVVSLGQQITPRWLHWSGTRTVGCRSQYQLPCAECDRGLRRRWAAYLPVLCWPGLAEAILELPQSAFYAGREQNPAWHGCLRGRWLLIKRPVSPYHPWTVERRDSTEGLPDPLPAPPDVPALLRRLWGLPEWATMKRHVHRPRDSRFGT
jgi:hypothetical protein